VRFSCAIFSSKTSSFTSTFITCEAFTTCSGSDTFSAISVDSIEEKYKLSSVSCTFSGTGCFLLW